MSTQYSVTGSVAIIHLDNPPVNGLPLSTRQGILRDLTRALDAPGIDSIVLTGNATDFSAGADISEVAGPRSAAGPSLPPGQWLSAPSRWTDVPRRGCRARPSGRIAAEVRRKHRTRAVVDEIGEGRKNLRLTVTGSFHRAGPVDGGPRRGVRAQRGRAHPADA
ncbi:enoyl-CoA hydratase-related protein [Rhodococcus sp. T2V]|uniref:enoyl-CoA hydratase-related protein n=1 Tax=Rhodococcus sp. T2V TaxID=3034164 RepID=UPI0023E13193|nr:enoyl-CoA hydratase-related protein [Rhodococcus sp. T2V]MDF3305225.1 enoyl-CoA hydratase-related protein [Rhodococcus sp. T2V]